MAHQGDVGGIVLDIEHGRCGQGSGRDRRGGGGCSGLAGQRQVKGEGRTLARQAGALQPPVHRLGQAARDGQPYPGPGDVGGLPPQPIERLEQFGHPVLGDADACVVDLQGDAVRRLAHLKQDVPALAIVLDGVGDEVDQDLTQPCPIRHDAEPGGRRRRAQGHSRRLGCGPQIVADLTDDQLGIYPFDRHRQLAGLDPREVQHLFDQAEQMLAGAEDLFDRLGLATRQGLGGLVHPHQLGEADDGVQGCPQFMRHAGEEVGLGLAGGGHRLCLFVGGFKRKTQLLRAFGDAMFQ